MVDIVAAVSAAAWLYLTLGHGRFWRTAPLLTDVGLDPPPRAVAAIIPARDEAQTITAAVQSLRAQHWHGELHVIIVDDGSSDGTGELASAAGASVIRSRALPTGWTGKMWALSQGVEHAHALHPEYLLFTDADIVHDSGSVRSLVAKAEAEGRDLVSVMVRLACNSAAERLLIPAFVFFFFMLYPPSWIADPRRRTAGAAGGCILIRPQALARAGGIEAIRGELIDDCALARKVKSSGGSLWLGLSSETRSVRSYGTFAEVRAMIARTAFTQLRYSSILLAGTAAGMAFLYVIPVLGALRAELYGIFALGLMMLCFMPLARFYGQPGMSGLLLPFVAVYYLFATLESAFRYWSGRGGTWKGRHQAAAAGRG